MIALLVILTVFAVAMELARDIICAKKARVPAAGRYPNDNIQILRARLLRSGADQFDPDLDSEGKVYDGKEFRFAAGVSEKFVK